MLKDEPLTSYDLVDGWDFDMKIIKVLNGIQDYRSYSPLTFSPMKIGKYSFRISLRCLKEGGDGLN